MHLQRSLSQSSPCFSLWVCSRNLWFSETQPQGKGVSDMSQSSVCCLSVLADFYRVLMWWAVPESLGCRFRLTCDWWHGGNLPWRTIFMLETSMCVLSLCLVWSTLVFFFLVIFFSCYTPCSTNPCVAWPSGSAGGMGGTARKKKNNVRSGPTPVEFWPKETNQPRLSLKCVTFLICQAVPQLLHTQQSNVQPHH